MDSKSKRASLKEAIYLVHNYTGIEKLPKNLRDLQTQLFATHIRVDTLIQKVIVLQTLSKLGVKINDTRTKLAEDILSPMLASTFAKKLEYVKQKKYLDSSLIKDISCLNKYRNDFAHLPSKEIVEKYQDVSALTEVRKLVLSVPLDIVLEVNDFTQNHLEDIGEEDVPF